MHPYSATSSGNQFVGDLTKGVPLGFVGRRGVGTYGGISFLVGSLFEVWFSLLSSVFSGSRC